MLNFINENGPLWSLCGTIATILYVIFTYRLLKETIKARRQQSRPYVLADVEYSNYSLKVVVKNIGNDGACNVNVSTDPIIDNPFSKIEFLAPNKEIFNVITYIVNKDSPQKYNFIIDYYDSYKNKYHNEYSINVSNLIENMDEYDNNLLSALKGIKSELDNISRKIR